MTLKTEKWVEVGLLVVAFFIFVGSTRTSATVTTKKPPSKTMEGQGSGSNGEGGSQPQGGWNFQCGCAGWPDGSWNYRWGAGSGPGGSTWGFGSGSGQTDGGAGFGFGWGDGYSSGGGSGFSDGGYGATGSFGPGYGGDDGRFNGGASLAPNPTIGPASYPGARPESGSSGVSNANNNHVAQNLAMP